MNDKVHSLEVSMKEIKTEITYIKSGINDIKSDLKCFMADSIQANEEMEKRLNEKLQDKANKWVERVVWSAGAVVGTTVLLALLSQILI